MSWSASRPTIQDVAALSGVSKTTVSNVLRGSGRVAGATRRRVLASVDALGYRPNGLARDLVRLRARTIGVVVGDLANPFYAELVKALEHRASAAGYTTMICNTDGRLDLEAARIEGLLERTVSGVALLQFSGDASVLEALRAARVPAVLLSTGEQGTDSVTVDDHAGMALAVAHLHGLGHRRIAFVSGPLIEEVTHRSRYAGYAAAMRALGLRPMAPAGDDAGELLGARPAVTALVAANDLLAVRSIDALEAAGLRVPRDVSVVGLDGIGLGAHRRIGLTTVTQPHAALAEHGVDILVERARNGLAAEDARHIRLAPTLVVRHSTGPAPARRD